MIKENVEKILKELPAYIELAAAVKGRTIIEVEEAVNAGVTIIGENYIKEAEDKFKVIGSKVKRHLIGHLQKNKVKKAVKIFDMIETVDSLELARAVDKECKKIDKIMEVLIEVNIAQEPQKNGVLPRDVEALTMDILKLSNLKLKGLMTMGPLADNSRDIRPFFKETKDIFERIKLNLPSPNIRDWKCLSMGMSGTYKIAVEEGANIVRIGTGIFGKPR